MIKNVWKKIISIGLIASSIAVVPIVATTNIFSNNLTQSRQGESYYFLDNSVYNSQQEAIDSIKNQAEVISDVVGIDNSYFLNNINENKNIKFSNSSEYKDFLNKYIQNISAKSSLTYDQIEKQLDPNDNSLPLNVLKRLAIDGTNNNEIKIYRGHNGEIFLNEEDAKMSYFRIYDGYQYNNIYFRSKEELKYYLKTVHFANSSTIPNIKEKYILGLYDERLELFNSIPLDIDATSIDSIKANKQLEKYLNALVQREIVYEYDDNGSKKNISLKTDKDLEKAINNPVIRASLLEDLSYFRMYDTNAKAGFIVDSLATDDAEFVGQNYVETNQDIQGIAKWQNWNSVNNEINQRFESTLNDSLSSMFNYFALETPYKSFGSNQEILNNAYWFNYAEISSNVSNKIESQMILDTNSLNDWFKKKMLSFGSKGKNLYFDILNNAIKLESTKNFNSFLKIPTLFSMAMNLIYDRELSHVITDTVRTYFIEVAKFLDKKILNLIPGEVLKSLNGDAFFSFVTFFNLDNNNNNFNQNIKNVYLDKLKTDYPFLAVFSLFQNSAKVNQQTTLGSWKFDKNHYYRLVNDFIDNNITNNSDISLIRSKANNLVNEFTYLWELFSVPNADELYYLFDNYKDSYIWNTNKTIINTLLDDSYIGTNINDFVTFNSPEKQIINANSLIYYKDYNTRTKLADFLTFSRYLQKNPSYQMYMPKGITRDSILNALNQANTIFNSFNNRGKKSYDYKQVVELTSIYKQTIATSYEVQSSFEIGVSNIYKQEGRLSIFTNQSLQTLEVINIEERSLIVESQISIESESEKYLGDVVLEKVEAINDGLSALVGTFNVFKKIISNGYQNIHEPAWVTANKILRDVVDTGILKIFGPWGKVANIIASAFIPTVKDLAYSFELNNSEKWYRVGGTEHSMLFGLIKWQNNTIKDMKIDKPIQIYKNRNEENYYYNSKKYIDLNKLLYDQLRDIISGRITNKNFPIKYFHYNKNNIDKPDNISASQTLEEANNKIYHQLLDEGLNKSNSYIDKIVKDYNGNNVNNSNEVIELMINQLTNNNALRATKFINLPYIKDGVVDLSKSNEIPTFKYPISWNQANDTIINSINTNSLIVNNPIYIYVENNSAPPSFEKYENTIEEMTTKFLTSFDVSSKTTIKSEIIYNNDFDYVSNSVTDASLYKVNIPSMQTKFFVSYDDAINYLEEVFKLKIVSNELTRTKYLYNDMEFDNIKELENYILKNIKCLTKQELDDYLQGLDKEVQYA